MKPTIAGNWNGLEMGAMAIDERYGDASMLELREFSACGLAELILETIRGLHANGIGHVNNHALRCCHEVGIVSII